MFGQSLLFSKCLMRRAEDDAGWHRGGMHIQRVGFTPVKGGRHLEHDSAALDRHGVVGDRDFSLVDPARGRVLKTVENPALLSSCAHRDGDLLTIDIGDKTITALPRTTGEIIEMDYWGRPAAARLVEGPWAAAYTELLGREVALIRSAVAGEFVYGATITIVTTASLRRLAELVGHEVRSERFRANFVVDTDDLEPHVEDSWDGREFQIGTARLRIRGGIDRCAVIDFDPETGASGTRLLRTLAGYRRHGRTIDFGVFAEVIVPGRIARGDRLTAIAG